MPPPGRGWRGQSPRSEWSTFRWALSTRVAPDCSDWRLGCRAAAWLGLVGLLAGCAVGRPTPLELLPGHRAVLGRVELGGYAARGGQLQLARVDGTYFHDLAVPFGAEDFAISLPPGRYRITRVTVTPDPRSTPMDVTWDLKLAFEVGPEPAVYIGTLRVTTILDQRYVEVSVTDQYDRTVPALRARYPGLDDPVRRLIEPI